MLPALILGVFLLVLVGLVLLTIPRHITRTAAENCRRSDGSWSKRRARREAKHVAELFGALHLVVVLFLVLTGGALMTVHHYIVPLPLVANVFSVFDPDPVQWEANRTDELPDVGDTFDAWRERQGFSQEETRRSREFLWTHWLLLAFITLVLGACYYWFLARFFMSSVARYGKGVLKRKKHYTSWDLRHSS